MLFDFSTGKKKTSFTIKELQEDDCIHSERPALCPGCKLYIDMCTGSQPECWNREHKPKDSDSSIGRGSFGKTFDI